MKPIPHILFLAVLIAACQPAPAASIPSPTTSQALAATPTDVPPAPTEPPTAIPATPSPVPPTPTPTPELSPVISPANAATLHLNQLAGFGEPRALRYSPDGHSLFYAGSRGACYFNLQNLEKEHCFIAGTLEKPNVYGYQQMDTSQRLSADGQWFMEQFAGSIRSRSLPEGDIKFAAKTTLDKMIKGEVSPTGKYLAAFSIDNEVVPFSPTLDVWDVSQEKLIASLAEVQGYPWLAIFSPDDQSMMVKTGDWQFQLWDHPANELSEPLNVPGKIITGAVFSPDGQLLAGLSNGPVPNGQTEASGNGSVTIYRLSDRQVVWSGQTQGPVRSAAFSPDGRLFAAVSSNKTIRVYTVADWQVVQSLTGTAPYGYKEVKFSPSGILLAATPAGAPAMNFAAMKQLFPLTIWNTTDGSKAAEFESGAESYSVNTLDFSPDEKSFSLVTPFELGVWSLDPFSKVASIPIRAAPEASAFTSDGKSLLTSFQGGQLMSWDLAEQRFTDVIGEATPDLVGEYFRAFSFSRLAVSPDGRFAAASGVDVPVRIWDLNTRNNLGDFFEGENIVNMQFSPDGSRLAVLTGMKIIATGGSSYTYLDVFLRVVQLPSGEVSEPFHVFGRQRYFSYANIYKLFFAGPDGKLMLLSILKDTNYSSYTRADLKVTDLDDCPATAKTAADCPSSLLEAPSDANSYFCTHPAINAEGTKLAARCHSSADINTPTDWITWDLGTGKILKRFFLCNATSACRITYTAISPDGRVLALGIETDLSGQPKTYSTEIWDTVNGKMLIIKEGMAPMLFSPDGRYLAFLVNPVQFWRAEIQ